MSHKLLPLLLLSTLFLTGCVKENLQDPENSPIASARKTPHYVSPFPYCQNDPNPIGGDAGYNRILTPADADIYISSFSSIAAFKSTIESSAPGSVIYIADHLSINLSGMFAQTGSASITVPANVTLASGRGSAGGALIYTNDFSYYNNITQVSAPLFIAGGDGIRFTGLRLRGPSQSEGGSTAHSAIKFKTGIFIAGHNHLEVDNCDLYGWPYAAIRIGAGYSGGSFSGNNVHHNHFFHNRQRGLGYGVVIDHGFVLIKANIFTRNRHDIADSGKKGSGYEASCNTIPSGGTSHNFDMHAEGPRDGSENAGRFVFIHHNDFLDTGAERYQAGNAHNIVLRGRPDVQFRVENNRFRHSGPQAAIKQQNSKGGFGNLLVWNNIYDNDDYLGWYVKPNWLKTNASNFLNLPSSNDALMQPPPSGSNYNYAYTFGDYDGDGATDIYKLENGTLYVLPYDASSFGIGSNWQPVLTTGYPMSTLRFGFYNGDHRTDIIRQGGNTIFASFGANTSWTPILNTGYPLASLKSGDFDGNGTSDLFLANGSTWRVSFNSNSNWQTINTSGYAGGQLALGRFNSNNKSDVFLANGSQFKVSWEGTSSWANLASSGYLTSQLYIADFSGDNISDVILPNSRLVSVNGNTTWKACKTGNFPLSSFSYGNF